MKGKKTILTEEQLIALPVGEWVWIEVLQPFSFEEKTSAYYRKQVDYTHGKAFICGYPGISFGLEYSDYSKTWVAYTERPLLRCVDCEYFLRSVDLCKAWECVTDDDGYCHRGKLRGSEAE